MNNGKLYQAFRIVLGLLAAITMVRICKTDVDPYTTDKGRRLQKSEQSSGAKVYETSATSVVYIDCFGPEQAPEARAGKVGSKTMEGENKKQRILNAPKIRQTPLSIKAGDNDGIVPKGSGSGYIWSVDQILTNNHVVADCSRIEVSLLSKKDESTENQKLFPMSTYGRNPTVGEPEEFHWRVVTAELVGRDPDSDIAVLKINAPHLDLQPIKQGDESKTSTGDDCFAIGNPFGLDHSLSRGIVSAKGRVFTSESGVPMVNLIQTDASINPGNSGGPLLNSEGEMIGMNTMIISKSGSSSGIGFAIPISRIKQIADIIMKKGEVRRPMFGVHFGLEVQTYFGISKGALVYDVFEPALSAGLKPTTANTDGSVELGDVITKMNGREINSDLDAYVVIDGCKPGQVVKITVDRRENDEVVEKTLSLKLG